MSLSFIPVLDMKRLRGTIKEGDEWPKDKMAAISDNQPNEAIWKM